MTTDLLIADVEVEGRVVDVVVERGTVTAIGPRGDVNATERVDGRGGALIPGLHDHHLHLLATAAALTSVDAGPPAVRNATGLAAALQAADRSHVGAGWLRAVGYHESVAGLLDRELLDSIVPHRPLRVQHRSGGMWVLNSAALDVVERAASSLPADGVERDGAGRATGRLFRLDRWLRDVLPIDGVPDLGRVGRRLARFGITGVTDTTPYEHVDDLRPLVDAVRAGALPQRVAVTGSASLASERFPEPLEVGPVKIVLEDHTPPPFDDFVGWIEVAHARRRPVAVHCVTRAALALALAAWDAAGVGLGDRIEHGAVIPPEFGAELAARRLTVVTQPGFVFERGDDYLDEVDPEDRPFLYPCRSLLDRGVLVAGSTDSPYSDGDPWTAIATATSRTTVGGRRLVPSEAIAPHQALALFLGELAAPGGLARRVAVGATADLCLLDRPLAEVLAAPSADRVVATFRAGRRIHGG
jgi:predicted amidohydrolase YtcJ